MRDGEVVYSTENFQKNYISADKNLMPLNVDNTFNRIFSNLSLDKQIYKLAGFNEVEYEGFLTAKQRLVYFNDNGNLVLAYEFLIPEDKSSDYWNVIADAKNGNILKKTKS